MKQLLLIVVCLTVVTEALAQQPAHSQYGLPPGPWNISCGPRLKQRGPVVDLYKVGSSVLTGITVVDVWLENRSKQGVAGVKIANYRIEVWVSDVRFADETGQQVPAAFAHVKKLNSKADAAAAFVEAKSEPASVEQEELGCQNQQCSWSNQDSCYKCGSGSGGTCKWFNCTYCEDGRCPRLGD